MAEETEVEQTQDTTETIDRNKWIDQSGDLPNFGGETTETQSTQETTETVPTEATEITAEQTEQPLTQTDFAAQYKAEFGDTDLKTLKQKYAEYEAINTEYSTIKPEYEKLKTTPPVAPYKTQGVEKIDEWLSKGVKLETIARFGKMDVATIPDDEAIKLQAEIQNPAWQPKHIEADFNSKYIHEPDELKSDEANSNAQNLKEAAKLQAAAKAKEFLTEYLGKEFNPSGELEGQKAKEQEVKGQLTNFWKGQESVLTNTVKQVSNELVFKVQGEKGEEEIKLPVSFVVPENDLNQLRDMALNAAINSNVEPTESGVKQVQSYLNDLVWAKFGPKILQAGVQDALSAQNKAFQKLIHNPTLAQTIQTSREQQPSGREGQWMKNLKGRNQTT